MRKKEMNLIDTDILGTNQQAHNEIAVHGSISIHQMHPGIIYIGCNNFYTTASSIEGDLTSSLILKKCK